MSHRITILDVARAARVSPSTVSRALTGQNYRLSQGTRDRIVRLAAQMGYSPNPIARGLATGVTDAVGIVVPGLRNPYPLEFVEQAEKHIARLGYETWLLFCHNDRQLMEARLRTLLAHRVRGIFFTPADFCDRPMPFYHQLLDQFHSTLPVVLFNERFDSRNRFVVNGANFDGAIQAVEYLLRLGHRRIAFLAGAMANSSLRDRYQGYRTTLMRHNIPFDEALVLTHIWCQDMTYDFAPIRAVLDLPDPPTAIFSCSDFIALAVMRFLKDGGWRIPDDISVMGFDNIELCNYLAEPLTSVGFSLDEMAAQAVQILQDFWASDGNICARDICIPARLFIRKSTALNKMMTIRKQWPAFLV